MKRLILIGDRKKERINTAVNELQPWLNQQQVKIVATDLANRLDLSKAKADLILVLGGDGSIISTARRLNNNPIPVIGVNLGKFGFLAEYSLDELKESFKEIITKRLKTSSLMMLDCLINRGARKNGPFIALNDIVITRGSIARMVYFRLFIDGQEIILTVDGQVSMYLRQTDRITLRKSKAAFRLVRLGKRNFYETIREKLHWGGQPHSQRYL